MSTAPTSPAELPRRSAKQREEALAQANLVRIQRAQLKADLKQGRCSLAALIAEPPDYLVAAKPSEMLGALPRYGRVKVARLLERCRVSPKKTIGGLSARQRREIVSALEE